MVLNVISIFINWSTPIFTSVAAIGSYQYFIGQISTANVLSSITIFGLVSRSIWLLPDTINILLDSIIALNRIQVNF